MARREHELLERALSQNPARRRRHDPLGVDTVRERAPARPDRDRVALAQAIELEKRARVRDPVARDRGGAGQSGERCLRVVAGAERKHGGRHAFVDLEPHVQPGDGNHPHRRAGVEMTRGAGESQARQDLQDHGYGVNASCGDVERARAGATADFCAGGLNAPPAFFAFAGGVGGVKGAVVVAAAVVTVVVVAATVEPATPAVEVALPAVDVVPATVVTVCVDPVV